MNIRLEGTYDPEEVMEVFLRHDLEAEEDEFTAGHTTLLKGFVAYNEDTGQKIGAAALAERQGRIVINGIAVDEPYRRAGVASELLALVLDEARRRGDERIWIVARAPKFFEAHNFLPVDEREVPEGLFDCFACPQYKIECFPKLMIYDLAE